MWQAPSVEVQTSFVSHVVQAILVAIPKGGAGNENLHPLLLLLPPNVVPMHVGLPSTGVLQVTPRLVVTPNRLLAKEHAFLSADHEVLTTTSIQSSCPRDFTNFGLGHHGDLRLVAVGGDGSATAAQAGRNTHGRVETAHQSGGRRGTGTDGRLGGGQAAALRRLAAGARDGGARGHEGREGGAAGAAEQRGGAGGGTQKRHDAGLWALFGFGHYDRSRLRTPVPLLTEQCHGGQRSLLLAP
mmetsp:Transcript_120871/g.386945  ORF Transcript_120871/g.386945 Transcript_120871/m.386945 type:complete len:242 (-) Transcript_120871:11-736(-)